LAGLAQPPATPQPPATQAPATQAPPPVFRSGADVIAIDVAVTTDKGDVVPALTASDFKVEIDGKPRQVVSAEWIRQDPAPPGASTASARSVGADASSNEAGSSGRLVLLAFDADGLSVGAGRGAALTAGKFLDQLAPTDQVGLIEVPRGKEVPFTLDRAAIRDALSHIVGQQMHVPPIVHSIGISEAFDVDAGNTFALSRMVDRECPPGYQLRDPSCPKTVQQEAGTIVEMYRTRSDTTLRAFAGLLGALGKIEGPKIVIWISGGLPLAFQDIELGTLVSDAAAANTTVYVVHLDSPTAGMDASEMHRSPSAMEDRSMRLRGLEILAGATRGAVFSSSGDGSNAFDRISREIRAYYLLGAEALPSDRDGHRHKIKVTVLKQGAFVRARREFTVATSMAGGRSGTPEEQVRGVLEAPLIATELPLKVATYSLRAPAGDKVRVVVASDIGRKETATLQATVGYVVSSAQGKVVASAFTPTTADLLDPGTPGAVHSTVAIDLLPGKYRLKLAVVDATGRRGSVERTFEAGIAGAAGFQVADLMLTPPLTTSDSTVRLTASPLVEADALDAYIELYGPPSTSAARVRVEVADSESGPALSGLDVPIGESREKGRFSAEGPLPLGLLPPGNYHARAIVTAGSSTVTRFRRFTMNRAVPADDVFKNELHDRVGVFDPASVMTPALLGPAVARALELDGAAASGPARSLGAEVAAGRLDALKDAGGLGGDPSVLSSFLRGLQAYQSGSIEDAANQFRAAVRASPDFLPGVFYLGACYAKGGKIRESIGAWQTALTGDEPRPEVYQMIADAYLRLGDADEAASLLEEAGSRWPDDTRFGVTSALARAANGHPEEALAGLKPWLDRPTPDPDAMALSVRLAVASLAAAKDQAAAVAELRAFAERFTASGKPLDPLVARWLAYLDATSPK
jgi:VWFA-related protein